MDKNQKKTFLLILILLGFIVQCGIAYRNDEVSRFIGQTESALTSYYEPPAAVTYDSEGRKVLLFEWTTESQRSGRVWTDSSGVTHYEPPQTITHVEQREYVLDKTGRIIKGKWRFY